MWAANRSATRSGRWMRGCASTWAIRARRENSPEEDAMTFVLQVDIRIAPGNVAAFMAKLEENAAAARREPGCRQFDVLVDPADETHVMLYEKDYAAKEFERHHE